MIELLLKQRVAVLAGVALLAFFLKGAPFSVQVGLVLWGVFFDGTHVLGTFTHSKAHAAAGQRGWLLLFLGPVIALVGFASGAGWLFQAFLLFAYLWAYFHLVRQHYGFVALYRRQARATDWVERRLETWLLWVGCLYPYLRFSLSPAYAQSGLPVLTPHAWVPALRLALDVGAGALGVGLAVALVQRNKGQLGPRHLLIATVIAFHVAVFALLDHLLVITAALTVFHNLQYHRIIWDHAKREGRRPANGLGRYLALGIALGAVWYLPRYVGVAFAQSELARNLLLGVGWGVAMVHYYVDVGHAMGANLVDQVAEHVAPELVARVGGRIGLRILSNLPLRRLVRCEARVSAEALGGEELADGIARASLFAEKDIFRAVTHNKGVMNGIDAVALALGQDWRSIEAGAHAFAALSGSYRPIATWTRTDDGLLGKIELPMAVATVGGSTQVHQGVRAAFEPSASASPPPAPLPPPGPAAQPAPRDSIKAQASARPVTAPSHCRSSAA